MIDTLQNEDMYVAVKVNLTEASLNNADAFKQQLITLLDRYQKHIIIDLRQVEYVDSSFLGALVAILKHAISLKKEVLLTGLRKDIYNLMALIRLDKVFKIYANLQDAAQSLQ